MVEIIHDATKENDAPRVAQCRKCKSMLRFRPSEGRSVSDQRDGDSIVITCPVCSNELWLSETAHHRRMAAGY